MTLASGTSLGPYEIVGPLGEGGMGVVYRARDTQLDREVALKVLPDDLVADPERVARFEREARVLASLNHPNIAQIHGFERQAGTPALVMELVEGPTLDERLADGAMPVEESLEVARQIAEALEQAHGAGIIHRDLKPQNIKVAGGDLAGFRVKVLDFGLAKALDGGAIGSGGVTASALDASPTLVLRSTADRTMQGVILGSAPYMAPEQAKGLVVDKRADIWAFGVVLWEMLTGRRLFGGDSVPETLAEVLKGDIELAAVPTEVPPAVRRLLRRCLERNPRNRLHDIADARIVLEEQLQGDPGDENERWGGAPPAAESSTGRFGVFHLLAVAVVTALVAAVLGFLAARPETTAEPESLRLSIQVPPRLELAVAGNSLIGFTNDGDSLVFQARERGELALFRRRLGDPVVERIEGTVDADGQFLSPDGESVGFSVLGKLVKVPIEGGRPLTLTEASGAGGAVWLSDDTLVFAPTYSDGLFRLSPDGGEVSQLTEPDRDDGVLGHWWPDALPGERRVVFTAFRTPVDRSRIGVLDLDSGAVTWVLEGGFFARWSPSGHLLFARSGRLMAVSFNLETLEVRGNPVQMVEDLRVSPTGGWAMFALSSQGTLAYVSESAGNPERELVWIDRRGQIERVSTERNRFVDVALSPDGRRAATTIQGASFDLWLMDLQTRALSRLTADDGTEFSPAWTGDGREILYVRDRPPFELMRLVLGQPDSAGPLWGVVPEHDTFRPTPSPDGRNLAFVQSRVGTEWDVMRGSLDGSQPPVVLSGKAGSEFFPTFSPDGRWIAFSSEDTGRPEVYVQPFPGPGERIQVTADGGDAPLWASTGEIFYRRHNEFRVLSTQLGDGFRSGPPQALFELAVPPGVDETSRSWDVSADGERILAVYVPEELRPRRIEIVTEFFAELERRAPSTSSN